jgi:hypothetical protein
VSALRDANALRGRGCCRHYGRFVCRFASFPVRYSYDYRWQSPLEIPLYALLFFITIPTTTTITAMAKIHPNTIIDPVPKK